MKRKLEGIDISHWNRQTVIDEYDPGFVIMKATEGCTYRDDQMNAYYNQCVREQIPCGFYHYARAERNDAIKEADWFISNLPKGAIGNCVLALDFEGKSLSIKLVDDWALRFLARVEQQTGVKPLLYVSQATVKRFPKVQAGNYGLWVARYRNKLLGYGDISPWKFAAIWQYTSNPIDRDVFYGTVEQFYKYGKAVKI